MRLKNEVTFTIVVLCSLVSISLAQQPHRTHTTHDESLNRHHRTYLPGALTPDEGLAILGAALESRGHPDWKSDCSHLVQDIYERAGFPFAYATSADLYIGTPAFRRVAHPQPGDLVAWRGHVGIVVNPAQRSFFSALRSGLGVSSYDSKYWRGRGRPHFFRYVTRTPVRLNIALVRNTRERSPSQDKQDSGELPDISLSGSVPLRSFK